VRMGSDGREVCADVIGKGQMSLLSCMPVELVSNCLWGAIPMLCGPQDRCFMSACGICLYYLSPLFVCDF
jgi:hypothetical protein